MEERQRLVHLAVWFYGVLVSRNGLRQSGTQSPRWPFSGLRVLVSRNRTQSGSDGHAVVFACW